MGGPRPLRLSAVTLLKRMTKRPVVIEWWRLLIYACFCLGVGNLSNAVLERVLAEHQWLMDRDHRGRSLLWFISIGLGLLAGRLLDRVFPLVPGQK